MALVGFGARPGRVIGNAPAGPKKYKVTTNSQYISPLVPPGFDCSTIHELGIDRMENFRAGAIMIFCGEAKGGEPEGLRLQRVLQACPKTDGAPDLWCYGRGSDHRDRDLSQYYSIGDIHYGQPR